MFAMMPVALRGGWSVLPGEVRDSFRAALQVDDAIWARARGEALAQALIHLRYFRKSNPVLAANARQVIREILAHCESVVSPRCR